MRVSKNLFTILILIFLVQCGYTAVYNNNKSHDLKIVILNMTGNTLMNKKIKDNLKNYFNNQTDNEFKLDIDTNYSKIILSKNAKGKASDYQLVVNTIFQINFKEINQRVSFEEKLKIVNIDDTFEQKKYENLIKNNFARSIKEKLMIKLNSLL